LTFKATVCWGFRALDYRYRFHSPLAFTFFVGAARYALATPAYGIYYGAGLQWRNIRPHWDLGFDYRYAKQCRAGSPASRPTR